MSKQKLVHASAFVYQHVVLVPTAPRNFTYLDLTNSSVTLTWRRPDPPNGLITQYNVSCITKVIIFKMFFVGILHWSKLTR